MRPESDGEAVPSVPAHLDRIARPRRLGGILLLSACLLGLGLLWLRAARSGERLLEANSEQLYSEIEKRGTLQANRGGWLSERSVLEVIGDGSADKLMGFASYDIVAHRATPLPKLLKAFQALHGSWPSVSPDGRRLMCWSNDTHGASTLSVLNMDGSSAGYWPAAAPRPAIIGRDNLGMGWMPDSRRYVVVYADKVMLFDIERPGIAIRIAIPKLSPNLRCVGCVPDGPLLLPISSLGRAGMRRLTLTHVRIGTDLGSVQCADVEIPAGSSVRHTRVSPLGDRLEWRLRFDTIPSRWPWLDTILRLTGIRSHDRDGIWVSNTDGSNMHEVGHVHDHDLHRLGWDMTGRRVTYTRGDYVWAAPAEVR